VVTSSSPDPLTAEEERELRERLRTAPSINHRYGPDPTTLHGISIAEWADRYRRLLATLDAARALPSAPDHRPVTHGRHCPCSACQREDWTNPNLAHCGMHGPSCPAVYAPILSASPPDHRLREAVEADPWSFNRGTLRERLEWCRMQHQVAADQGYPTPQSGQPGYRDGPTNARWHQDCADWYAEMVAQFDVAAGGGPAR
jgi:hypothetical protein